MPMRSKLVPVRVESLDPWRWHFLRLEAVR
jgi:hypothetical protein